MPPSVQVMPALSFMLARTSSAETRPLPLTSIASIRLPSQTVRGTDTVGPAARAGSSLGAAPGSPYGSGAGLGALGSLGAAGTGSLGSLASLPAGAVGSICASGSGSGAGFGSAGFSLGLP
jgi:hypothetical protein